MHHSYGLKIKTFRFFFSFLFFSFPPISISRSTFHNRTHKKRGEKCEATVGVSKMEKETKRQKQEAQMWRRKRKSEKQWAVGNGNQRPRKEKREKKTRFRDVHGIGFGKWEEIQNGYSIKTLIQIFAAFSGLRDYQSYCISVTETLKQTDRDIRKLKGSTYDFNSHCRRCFFFYSYFRVSFDEIYEDSSANGSFHGFSNLVADHGLAWTHGVLAMGYCSLNCTLQLLHCRVHVTYASGSARSGVHVPTEDTGVARGRPHRRRTARNASSPSWVSQIAGERMRKSTTTAVVSWILNRYSRDVLYRSLGFHGQSGGCGCICSHFLLLALLFLR